MPRRFGRPDLSDWVIHFVHARNPEHVLYDEDEEIPLPMDLDNPDRFEFWQMKDDYMARDSPMEPDAPAISVLLRILDDGHLRASWSVRGDRPTIYGRRPAVCFTEMPLGSFLQYARQRADRGNVDAYGIAIRKTDLFVRGGRPVIYGLSGEHRELKAKLPVPRLLDPSCGLAEHEQYRYVAYSLGRKYSDWTHEREWRWCDVAGNLDVPGFSLWLRQEKPLQAIVALVQTVSERKRVLDKLQQMWDARHDQYETALYSRRAIERTTVVALEEVPVSTTPLDVADIPSHRIKVVAEQPTPGDVARAANAVDKARRAATEAADAWRRGGAGGGFGFAWVVAGSPRSAIVQALAQKGWCRKYVDGYSVDEVTRGVTKTGLIGEEYAAAEAAADALLEEFPDLEWWVATRGD